MFAACTKKYVFADFFLNHRSVLTGLTLMDYVSLNCYLAHAPHRRLPPVSGIEGRQYDMSGLRDLLGEARRDLLGAISSSEKYQCRISLEEIYLMIVATHEGHLKPALLWDQVPSEFEFCHFQPRETQALVEFLTDFGTLVAMNPAPSSLNDWFMSTDEFETSNRTKNSFYAYERKMTALEVEVAHQERFRERLDNWFKPEFDRYSKWWQAVDREIWGRKLHTNYHTQLPVIGFPEEVIMAAKDPAWMGHVFIDTVKNWRTASAFDYAGKTH